MVKASLEKKTSLGREVAYIAVMCALLIGAQLALSAVAGVEVVTVLLISFSFVFGARRGALTALCFSLLRCAVFGFFPTAVILYLIYYPLLALAAALLGRVKSFSSLPVAVAVNILLLSLAAACAALYFTNAVKVAAKYALATDILLILIFSVCALLIAVYDGVYFSRLKAKGEILKTVTLAAFASVMTACFTLLDDIITPLFFGYSRLTALAYFYSSFTAMLPQIVCAAATVCTLFLPLERVFEKAAAARF